MHLRMHPEDTFMVVVEQKVRNYSGAFGVILPPPIFVEPSN